MISCFLEGMKNNAHTQVNYGKIIAVTRDKRRIWVSS
jgi:hypothetical protein